MLLTLTLFSPLADTITNNQNLLLDHTNYKFNMFSLPWPATLTFSFTALVWAAGPGVVHVPVVRGEAPLSALQQTLRKRASTNYASVDLQNLFSIYSINLTIAGQPTSVVLDTGMPHVNIHIPQRLQVARTWLGGGSTEYMLILADDCLAGSFELWVDPDCNTASRSTDTDSDGGDSDASSPQYCETIGRYDPSLSTSAVALDEGNTFIYADGTTIEVNYYTDTIGIGGLAVSHQKFGVSNSSNATALGIMGLGPNSAYGYNTTSQTYSYILDSLASREWPCFCPVLGRSQILLVQEENVFQS